MEPQPTTLPRTPDNAGTVFERKKGVCLHQIQLHKERNANPIFKKEHPFVELVVGIIG
jgi:hypothetical protein